MDYDKYTPSLFLIEVLSLSQRQDLIDRQRCENPTDTYVQLIMDRQQQRVDHQKKELAEALAKVAANN